MLLGVIASSEPGWMKFEESQPPVVKLLWILETKSRI